MKKNQIGGIGQAQAKQCLQLLLKSSTSFGCAAILYAFLQQDSIPTNKTFNSEGINDLTAFLLKTLGVESKNLAKNTLHKQLWTCLSNCKDNLFADLNYFVITPITECFKKRTQPDFDKIMPYFYLFEAKIKQVYGSQKREDNFHTTKMNF